MSRPVQGQLYLYRYVLSSVCCGIRPCYTRGFEHPGVKFDNAVDVA
jgi:hypothetical protein